MAAVLITGANGLLGSRLVARLAAEHCVIAQGRGPARGPAASAEYHDVDLMNPGALRALIAQWHVTRMAAAE